MNGLNIFIGAIFLFILIMIIVKTISQFKEKKKSQEKEENKELNFNSHTIASIKDNSIELKSLYYPVCYPVLVKMANILKVIAWIMFAACIIISLLFIDIDTWYISVISIIVGIYLLISIYIISELIKAVSDISISTRSTLLYFIDKENKKSNTIDS
ncbi:MAG: hypothetical protein KA792_10580 [Bacteroidales bacterium]|jgi:Na+-transporting methylmalonyl-CoA/oxaloacetate decarboxylase gamma subunit|nr:hypothetical protein [Bacteroidales bacterium]